MNGESDRTKNETVEPREFVCGECGSKRIRTTQTVYQFPYGVGPNTMNLSCEVPLRNCVDCGFTFMDGEAENLCHEAVCKHLGLMTPKQIRTLRELYKLTQTQFCEITKLGDATLSRWERGIVVQNSAYDNYLYLLGFRENLDRLLKRHGVKPATGLTLSKREQPRFREIEVTQELRIRQEEFELQPCIVAGE